MARSKSAVQPNVEVQKRVRRVLQELADKGLAPRSIAARLEIPVQYLSDYKAARRTLSERIARRLGDEFGVNWKWLLGRRDTTPYPSRKDRIILRSEREKNRLPIFADPIEGDPRLHSQWDGGSAEVGGAAREKVGQASQPYLLRFGADDCQQRLCRGDLILISQSVLPANSGSEKAIQVIRDGAGLCLARRLADGRWQRLESNNPDALPECCTIHGHAVGIAWGALG